MFLNTNNTHTQLAPFTYKKLISEQLLCAQQSVFFSGKKFHFLNEIIAHDPWFLPGSFAEITGSFEFLK
jgi:hypothetical protein